MQPHQERVVSEQKELAEKLVKLLGLVAVPYSILEVGDPVSKHSPVHRHVELLRLQTRLFVHLEALKHWA